MLLITAIWLYILQLFHILGFGGNQYINFYSCGFSGIIILKNALIVEGKYLFWSFFKQHIKRSFLYTCSECGAMQKATALSKIINSIIYLALLIYFFYSKAFSLPVSILLLLGYILVGEPLLLYFLKYKKANPLSKE